MYIQTNDNHAIIQLIKVGSMPAENGYEIPDDTDEEILKDIFNYSYIEGEFVRKENADADILDRVRQAKIAMLSNICHEVIVNGFDYSDGHHYSLDENDQNSLNSLSVKASQGLTTIWHYDGGECQPYTPEEMTALTRYAFQYITYHQVYFNQLRAYVNSIDNLDNLKVITYGIALPDTYAEKLNEYTDGFSVDMEVIEDKFDYNRIILSNSNYVPSSQSDE